MSARRWSALALALALVRSARAEEETLPPLVDGRVPVSLDEMWGAFDPRREPLEVETLKEWTEGEIVCRIVRFRVGVFKGALARLAGIYAFPQDGDALPGLVQVHGGGQSANLNAALAHARRGYACLSLNWGGNPLRDGDYRPLWDDAGTDWGAVDGTHPPQRDPLNHFATCAPNEFTLDPVESPRNSAWLLVCLGVRRALTFLEMQPEVDGARLGVYGHSMGAKLTVMTAASDPRVRAAVPSCGGISDYPSEPYLENSGLLARVRCPTLFLNPANDFYGRIDDLPRAAAALGGAASRFSCAPNLDHRDLPEHFACGPLWFDEHLRGGAALPQSPRIQLDLQPPGGVPLLSVRPDAGRPPLAVDVYYTQLVRDAQTANPCWRRVPARALGDAWQAELPLWSGESPLRAYANVRYALAEPLAGAGYYYGLYETGEFVLSSELLTVSADALQAAGVRATDEPSLLIEEFGPDWQRGWYVFSEQGDWPFRTNKLLDPKWRAPPGARLALDVLSPQPNLLVVQVDAHAQEFQLAGGDAWQTLTLASGDLCDAAGVPLAEWAGAQELVLGDAATLARDGRTRTLGGPWQGPRPTFRRLRWEPAAASDE